MKKYILLPITLLLAISLFAQVNINDYKYIVVPLSYDFVKGKDTYRLNTLTRFLFKENGFKTFFDEEILPNDLSNDRCLALYADVNEIKGGLSSKLQIELKDCSGNLVFLSDIGKTKIKSYKKAYPIAIRKAFESIKFLNYKYQPLASNIDNNKINSENSPTEKSEEELTTQQQVTRLEKELKDLKQQNNEVEDTIKKDSNKDLISTSKAKTENKARVELKEEIAEVKEEIVEDEVVNEPKSNITLKVLYAQAISEGFQLVNAEPKVVMILLKTAAPNVFIVKDRDAIVFKQDNKWIYSENDGIAKFTEELNIKF